MSIIDDALRTGCDDMEDDNEVDVLDIDVPISIWRSNSETDAKFLGDRLVVV